MSAHLCSKRRLWPALAGLLFCFFLAGPALAAGFIWTGGGDATSWNDPDNWDDPPNIPGAGDTVTFNSNAAVTLGADRVVASVTANAGSISFNGGGTYSLTTSNLNVIFFTQFLEMANLGDHFYVTSSINMGANDLYLHGPGYFHVQGANNINCTTGWLYPDNNTKLNLNGDQTINWPGVGHPGAGTEIVLSNSATLIINLDNDSRIESVISGDGSLEMHCGTMTTSTLAGANTYNGSTTVASGNLDTSGINTLPIGTGLFIAAGALAHLNSHTVSSLTGSGALSLQAGSAFRLNGGGTYTFSGNIWSGWVGDTLEKDGAGAAILTGTINPDVIVTSGSLAATGPFTRSVTINGGAFMPGNGIGAASVGAGLFMQAGGSLNTQASGGTADRVNVTGAVDLNNGTLSMSGAPSVGASFTIIDNDGVDAVTGIFAGLPEGQTFTGGGYQYEITYVGGDGNDVVLTVLAAPPTPAPDPDPDPEPEPEPEPKPGPKPTPPKGSSPNPAISLNGPSLSWPAVSGARAYRVYRAACPACPKEEIGRVPGTSFVDQSAQSGQVYYYFVRGEGSGELSDYSDCMAAWRYEQNPGRAGDFNGDGITDLLWWEPDTGQLRIWLMNAGAVQSVVSPGAGQDIGQWLLINVGDFNQDGVSDIVWWNPAAGSVVIWYLAATSSVASGAGDYRVQDSSSPGQIAGNSTLSYTGDLNGDGRSDILWRDYETGQITLWIMGAGGQPALNGRPGVAGSLEWAVRGLFDMDGDGKADVIWQHASDGRVVVWRMDGSQALGFAVFQQDENWRLAGMGDLDGDGKAVFVWSNPASGAIKTWLMRGFFTDELTIVAGSAEAAQWQVKAVGDFCQASCADVYCKNSETGAVSIVKLDGQAFTPSVE